MKSTPLTGKLCFEEIRYPLRQFCPSRDDGYAGGRYIMVGPNRRS